MTCLFLYNIWLFSTSSTGACVLPLQNVRTECRNMSNVHTESIKESVAVLTGWWEKNQDLGGCLWVYFELYYPYYRRVSALHPRNAECAGGHRGKHLLISAWPSFCPFIHQLFWWQSARSDPLFFCLSLIFQIITPSTHPSVLPSSNSYTLVCISASSIHPSIHVSKFSTVP